MQFLAKQPLSADEKAFLVTNLRKTPLLSKLSDDDLGVLAEELQRKEIDHMEYFFHEGEAGDGFYVIIKGSCLVTKLQGKEPDQKENVVAKLGEGDFFGEGALINEAPRGASIQAQGKVTCAFWTTATFKRLKGERLKGIRFVQRKAICAEMVPSLASDVDDSKREKTEEQKIMIYNSIKQNDLFKTLSSTNLRKVIEMMHLVEIKQGVDIITQGEIGYRVYVVESGVFGVYIKTKEEAKKHVADKKKGGLFGEVALLFNAPRNATVSATTDASCWAIDRFRFRNILKDVGEAETKSNVAFLRKVELLQPLTEGERRKIAEALEEVSFKAGDDIVRQGDYGSCMYIVKSGKMQAYVSGKSVKDYGPGGIFGEKALMDNDAGGKRAATITCDTDCICLELDKNAVFGLLGPLHDDLREQSSKYNLGCDTKTESNNQTTNAEATNTTPPLVKTKVESKVESKMESKQKRVAQESKKRPVKQSVTKVSWKMGQLKPGRVLGKGSFGVVKIVTSPDGSTYALKGVGIESVVSGGQQPHIVSEKKVMEKINHPFLVKLFGTYKDKSCVYFLLELCHGGELFTILRARTRFSLYTAKFYAASVVLMFEYMHSFNIVYRDLKPENLLIDHKGFLKLTDFGFAKEISGKTYTLCGTPDYLAPELISGKGHGKAVDWWTLGILLFEMIASFPPFYDDDPQRTYAKILYKRVGYPADTFTKEGKSMINRLLNKKPHLRLGVLKGEASKIKSHAFFKGFNFEELYQKKLAPPIKTDITDKDDVSAFEDYGDDDDKIPTFVPPNGYDASWEKNFG